MNLLKKVHQKISIVKDIKIIKNEKSDYNSKSEKIKLTDYQIDILESFKKIKLCDTIISISKNRNPGPHVIEIEYNGKKLTDSSLKK